jgi:hypothetical protein
LTVSKEINDKIDEWHESDSPLSLQEWLGMSRDEYAAFVEGQAGQRVDLTPAAWEQLQREAVSPTPLPATAVEAIRRVRSQPA